MATELSMEAKEETIAAVSAATTKPLNPGITNSLINQGYALSLSSPPPALVKASTTPGIVLVPSGWENIT